ncbi:MAG: hypothetical protein KIT81_14200 [Alphaproteobacteria bacterium]|nr:hypothetical protein [Alphaproteobacteria bacterium]
MKILATWLLAGSFCLHAGIASAGDFLLEIHGGADSVLSGKLILTRPDGSRIEQRLDDLRPGRMQFAGRAILLTLRIENASTPVQAELYRGASRVAQAMASGSGGVMSLSAVR